MKRYFAVVGAVVAVTLALIPLAGIAEDEAEYTFKVHNTTKDKITKLLASEDGKEWGNFDIGSGIKPDETVTLKWDQKTNESDCKWYFKAVFADGEESEAKQFDFCEDDLELEF
ncbi:MAG TPA: hypothetical protein VJ719_14080 [Chthoniobacterales bacterium]|nr:hypothetical protein [Chthoniobacterales bacterium]